MQMLALLGRKAGEAWCCHVVLASISFFYLIYGVISQESKKGAWGGLGNRVGALSSACCWLEHNKTAGTADTPHPSSAKGWGKPVLVFIQTALKRGQKQTLSDVCFPSSCSWPKLSSPASGGLGPGIPHCFSYTSNDVISCPLPLAIMSPCITCKFHLPYENEVLGAVMEWNLMHPEGQGGEGKDMQTDVPCPYSHIWAFWRSSCARMLLAMWQACIDWAGNTAIGLLNKILGLTTVVLDTTLNLSHKVHIFSYRFLKE